MKKAYSCSRETLLVFFKRVLVKIKSAPFTRILKNKYLCISHSFKQHIL